MKALLVINPISGDIDKSSIINKVRQYCAINDITLDIYKTIGKNDGNHIQNIFNEHDRVIVAGGDGTINLVTSALEDTEYIMGIIPAGSANGLANEILPAEDIDSSVSRAFSDSFRQIDGVLINDQLSLHLSDIGFNAEMIQNFEDSGIRGFLGYSMEFFNTLSDFAGVFHTTIETEDKRFEGNVMMVAIANAQKFGNDAMLNPMGTLDDGLFEIVIIREVSVTELFKFLINGISYFEEENVEIIQAKEVKISCETPSHFQIDGEYLGKIQEVQAKIMPAIITLAV